MMTFSLDAQKKSLLDQYFAKIVEDGIVPGLSAVVLAKEDIFRGCYGVKDLDTKDPITFDSLFDLASLTKIMVTTPLLLKLLEQQRVQLDDPLSKYLPNYDKDITIRECLTHTSGYRAGQIDYRYMSKQELVDAVLNHPIDTDLRGQCLYSDVNFILLGWVLETFYPSGLAQACKDNIFLPLGMHDTTYCPNDFDRCVSYEKTTEDGTIRGRVHDGKAFRLGGICGHAGLFSTPNDMEIFLRAMLDKDHRLFQPTTYELLDQPFIEDETQSRTLGWSIRALKVAFPKQAGRHTLFHSGFTGNFIYIDHDNDLGVVVLSNRIHPNRGDLRIIETMKDTYQYIYDILGVKP